MISLGASGGLFASSPQLLKAYLTKASNILHTKSVLLFPDAGAVRNPLVLKQYKRTIDLIQSLGFNVATAKLAVGIAWWGQVDKSHPDPDEFKGEYRIISPDTFFTYGLRYSAYFPGAGNRNLVKQFFNLLSSADTRRLQQTISTFKSQYQPQFDLIKRICWQHLSTQRKQFIFSVFS